MILYPLLKNINFQNEPIIEDLMLQQTMIQMKHQQILQQQILEVDQNQHSYMLSVCFDK